MCKDLHTETIKHCWQFKDSLNIVGPLHVRFYLCGFNQPQMENIQEKKIPENSKKQNLNLPRSEHDTEVNEVMCKQTLL